MKKLLTFVMALMLSVACVFGLVACNEETSSVTLVGLADGTAVTPAAQYDYFVVPEPAATTKVNATQGKLSFAGDLQALYGDGEGYPQAVVVAKKSVIESDGATVKAFVNSFADNKSWLIDDNTSSQTIVDAVKSGFISNDMTPTFTANNLNKQVIINSGLRYRHAVESKAWVLDYLAKVNAVSNNSFGTPVDNFFASVANNTANSGQTLSVYCPDGAPALSVARLLNDSSIIANIEINVVKASTIQTYVTGATPTADICILPVNAASKLLGNASTYQMLGTVTDGNLYILKKEGAENINKDNIAKVLNGKTVGIINLANVPGLTFKAILADFNIEFTQPA
ncbi:MAG: hypothetical protein IJY57_04180 [Clostridia bacterium]|nr:hypothetical protein [Clostridia bacterium]